MARTAARATIGSCVAINCNRWIVTFDTTFKPKRSYVHFAIQKTNAVILLMNSYQFIHSQRWTYLLCPLAIAHVATTRIPSTFDFNVPSTECSLVWIINLIRMSNRQNAFINYFCNLIPFPFSQHEFIQYLIVISEMYSIAWFKFPLFHIKSYFLFKS